MTKIEKAWMEVYAQEKVFSIDDLRADGWRSPFAEGLQNSESVKKSWLRNGRLERKRFCVQHSGSLRELVFFRPKL